MALEADANTVIGLGFYDHRETPGLGGEVDNPQWKAQWTGKRLFSDTGDVAIQLLKGGIDHSAADSSSKIDALAGATLTSRGVENLVKFWVGEHGFGAFLTRIK